MYVGLCASVYAAKGNVDTKHTAKRRVDRSVEGGYSGNGGGIANSADTFLLPFPAGTLAHRCTSTIWSTDEAVDESTTGLLPLTAVEKKKVTERRGMRAEDMR